MTEHIRTSVRSGVATLTLVQGRLDPDGHAELAAACRELDEREDVHAVVVRGRGSRFCVGDDPRVVPETTDGIAALGRIRVPTVAQVGGDALDAGFELALACDLRVAASGAHLGWTASSAGAVPFHGGTQRLPRIVGPARAARMLLLGESVSAGEACRIGLLHARCASGDLAAEVRRLVRRLIERGPVAQRLAKETLRAAGDLPLAEGLRLEGDLYVLLQTTRDRAEGVASFHEKRRPRFQGR